MLKLSTLLKFKVLTFNPATLKLAAYDLAQMAQKFQPNVIVAIRSGGYSVAELMVEKLPGSRLLPITCRRPGTIQKRKSSIVKYMLRKLPHFLTDRLRIIEHIILTQLRTTAISIMTPDESEITNLKQCLDNLGETAMVLIVDDAIDRGATMAFVHKTVNAIANTEAVIKMAAITVTTVSPLIEPDFSLYRYVLCRFPWSLDARN